MERWLLGGVLILLLHFTAINATEAAGIDFVNDSYHKVFFIDIDWKTMTCTECGSVSVGPGYRNSVDDWFSDVKSITVKQYKCCKNDNDICRLMPWDEDYYKYIGEGCIPQGGFLTEKKCEGTRTSHPPKHNVSTQFKVTIDSHRIKWKKLN